MKYLNSLDVDLLYFVNSYASLRIVRENKAN